MPIAGWHCPICNRDAPLDHYEASKCGLSIHPDYATAILRKDGDRYTKGLEKQNVVTVTDGLGCPRSGALTEAQDVYVNPLDYNALIIGSAWDRYLAQFAPEDSRKILLHGEVAGIELYGEIDRIRRVDGLLIIEDHKHGNNFQYKFVKAEGAKYESKIQTAIYAELYAQQYGERPTHGALWYHFSGSNKSSASPLLSFVYLLPTLEECLAHKPFNGEFTVEQLYRQAARYQKSKDGGIKVEAIDLPLAGVSMRFGTAEYCDYCEVRTACMTAAKGAPF